MAKDRVNRPGKFHATISAAVCYGVALILLPDPLHASGGWFEEAPPTLPFYLHRLPAKTIEQIESETAPKPPERTFTEYRKELEGLAARATSDAPATLVKAIDELLRRVRKPNWMAENGWAGGPALANLLHDVRDLFSGMSKENAAEVSAYFRWRLDHAADFGVSSHEEPRSRWDKPKAPPGLSAEIEQRLISASPALQPHWLYLRGALLFRTGTDAQSQEWFERVLAEHPRSPRAEAALFMSARCQLSRSRGSEYTQRDPVLMEENIPRAEQLFNSYLETYPKGRFAGDALGWLGALAFDQRQLTRALKFYIQQTELSDHPELRSAALTMCEKILSRIASAPDDAAFNEVARHPREAMALLYLIVNTTEADDFDGGVDEPEVARDWRMKILPRVSKAVAAQKESYRENIWAPRYLAILAHAASGEGRQREALELLALAGSEVESHDDLLFARALVLQRAGRAPEAIENYRAFIAKFPESPLARGTRLRLALALQDNHRAGEAIVELTALSEFLKAQPESSGDRYAEDKLPGDVTDAEPAQIAQLVDTLLNFAPLPELAQPLGQADLAPNIRINLSRSVAQRHLAQEDFENARKFMTPAEWGIHAEGIEKLTREAAGTKQGSGRASKLLALGDAWAAARKKLLVVPLDTEERRAAIFRGESASAGLKRRVNGRALLPSVSFDATLENRDELRHALNWWIKAADAQPGSELAAAALWRALKAIPKIADVSPYSLVRASESNAEKLSKEIFERLRHECPNSREARELAVYWSFPSPQKETNWTYERGYYQGPGHGTDAFNAEIAKAFQFEDDPDYGRAKKWEPIMAEILSLERQAGEMEAAGFSERVRRLQENVRKQYHENNEAFILNFADDLQLFAQQPDVPPGVRARYVQLRMECLRQSAPALWDWPLLRHPQSGEDNVDRDAVLRTQIAAARRDPANAPVADFLEFLDVAVVANHLIDVPVEGVDKDGEPFTYRSRDYKLVEQLTTKFLAVHPRSPKREATLLLRARAVYMLSRPVFYKKWADWPEADRWEGAFPPRFHQREKFEAKRVLGALNDYLQPFGKGRYFSELRSYRAAVATRLRDWDRALDLTLAQLSDAAHPELRDEGLRQLANIFARLSDDGDRSSLLTSIKQREAAKKALGAYLENTRPDHPLAYLKKFVADQIGVVWPKPTDQGQEASSSAF